MVTPPSSPQSQPQPQPVDPDSEVTAAERTARRPLHLQPRLIVWVASGGVLGAAARIGVIHLSPAPAGFPLATFVVNVVGAFVLGLLLQGLSDAGPDEGRRRLARLWAGTGFCGAFTTYSSFAVDTDELLRAGRLGLALAYVAATLVLGAVATLAGVAAAGLRQGRSL